MASDQSQEATQQVEIERDGETIALRTDSVEIEMDHPTAARIGYLLLRESNDG